MNPPEGYTIVRTGKFSWRWVLHRNGQFYISNDPAWTKRGAVKRALKHARLFEWLGEYLKDQGLLK